MQTSPIINQTNVAPGPASAAKQADANAPETSFNQVLSREVADRRGDAQKADAKEADNNAARQPAAGAESAAGAKPAGDTKSAEDDDASQDDTQTAAAASADMLALVANLGQVAGMQNGARETKAAEADARIALVSDNSKSAASAVKGAPSATESRFAALMDKAGSKKAQTDSVSANARELASATPASPALDLAAKVQEAARASSNTASAADLAAKAQETLSGVSATAMQSIQQAALNAAHAANGQAGDKLTPAVGTPAWDQALGQKVIWMVAGDQQSASLTLNPPDLGPLQVVLNISNSQANATFISAQPEVRQALEAAMPKLRDMLGDAGIQLGQATVSTGTPNQHNAPGEQQPHASRRAASIDSRDTAVRVGRVQPASSGQGLVDTFA